MSAIKNWTYVAIASYWRKIDGDDWGNPDTYAEPVPFLCSYKRKSQVVRNSDGNEIVSTMEIKTEESQIVEGDLIALGEFSTDASPNLADYELSSGRNPYLVSSLGRYGRAAGTGDDTRIETGKKYRFRYSIQPKNGNDYNLRFRIAGDEFIVSDNKVKSDERIITASNRRVEIQEYGFNSDSEGAIITMELKEVTSSAPPDNALTVLAVGQSLDLFDQEADDYTVNC